MRFFNNLESFSHFTQFLEQSNYNVGGQNLGFTYLSYTIPIRVGVEWFPSEHRLVLPIEGAPDFTYSTLRWASQTQFTTQPNPQI